MCYGQLTVIEGNRKQRPDWTHFDRAPDLEWIGENLHVFWPAATTAFGEHGRGAFMVDTTVRNERGVHPFGYFPQAVVNTSDDEKVKRIVSEYDPEHEFVVIMIRPDEHISTYRVRPRQGGSTKLNWAET